MKERKKSYHLLALEAVLRRFIPDQPIPPEIEAKYATYSSGHRGEKALDDPLSLLSTKDYHILPGIRLTHDNKHFFQIDTILTSTRFHLILEAKNYSKRIRFDTKTHNFEHILDDKIEYYPDPILQVQRQKDHLEAWLKKHKLPPAPIETMVVICNPRTQIEAQSEYDLQKVLQTVTRLAKLPGKIKQLEQRYKKNKITESQLRKITRRILKEDTPYIPNILQEYNIPKSVILSGVQCPGCMHIPMRRGHGKWHCSACSHTSNDAHIAALRDYALLFGREASCRDIQMFLQIPSATVTRKLLAEMGLPYKGGDKGRKYILPLDD